MNEQPKILDHFRKVFIERSSDFYRQLLSSVTFEPICNGRTASIIVKLKQQDSGEIESGSISVPIVRTTTSYNRPAELFSKIHQDIFDDFRNVLVSSSSSSSSSTTTTTQTMIDFNNAMIELYTPDYRRMGFHSDQALDLKAGSLIAIYSCYSASTTTRNLRVLVVKNKANEEVVEEIVLEHNSIVYFNLETNRNHLHKIVLRQVSKKSSSSSSLSPNSVDDHWIGITFRVSKTFVNFSAGSSTPILDNGGRELVLANHDQQLEFRRVRSEENRSAQFEYNAPVYYTISPSDLLRPKKQ